jgi:oligoribonuclease
MRLIWLDCETSGLDPSKHAILELAVGFASLSDPFRLKTMDRFVLRFDDAHTYGTQCGQLGSQPAWLGRGIDNRGADNRPCPACDFSPEARAMHARSGLLAECGRSTTTVREVEDYLLTLVHGEPERGDDRATLAGSTVDFDLGFLRAYAPRFAARVSYRCYDVSAVKLFCESLGMPRIPKAQAHRATADILESVQHAERCVEWLSKSMSGRQAEATLSRSTTREDRSPSVATFPDGSMYDYATKATDPTPPVWAVAFPSKTGPRHYLIDVDRVGWYWCTLCGRTHNPSLHVSASAKNYAGNKECLHADVPIPEAGAWCLVCGTAFLPGPTPARGISPCAEPRSDDSARVHILYAGLALCGLSSEVPAKWPPGHRWVSYEEKDALDRSNCDACKVNFRNFNVGQRRPEWTPAPSYVLPGEEGEGPQGTPIAEPDARCATTPDGGCSATDAACMHQPKG